MFDNQPLRPETMILRRIIDRRKELGLTTKQVAERVANSELYGAFTHTTLRNLETQNFEDPANPRTTLNKQLIIALSEALECDVSMLANHRELEAIRDVPYRRAQWPEFLLEQMQDNKPRNTVPMPSITAKRIDAYRQQYAYRSHAEFAKRVREFGYSVSDRDMQMILRENPSSQAQKRVITYEFCEAVARVFRGRMNTEEFPAEWLIKCQDRCPHCDPRMITY